MVAVLVAVARRPSSSHLIEEVRFRIRLTAGGRWIRTIGPPCDGRRPSDFRGKRDGGTPCAGTEVAADAAVAVDHLSFDFALSGLRRVASSMTLDGAAVGRETAAANGFDGFVFMIPR
jgi:hypothetical protein